MAPSPTTLGRLASDVRAARVKERVAMDKLAAAMREAHDEGMSANRIITVTGMARNTVFKVLHKD